MVTKKCKGCKKQIDVDEVHMIVYEKGKEIPWHLECFYKVYTPIDEEFKA